MRWDTDLLSELEVQEKENPNSVEDAEGGEHNEWRHAQELQSSRGIVAKKERENKACRSE
jgi:hypothetical protein